MHQLQFMLSIEHKFLSSEMSLPLYMMLHHHYLTYGKDGALLDQGDDPAHPTEAPPHPTAGSCWLPARLHPSPGGSSAPGKEPGGVRLLAGRCRPLPPVMTRRCSGAGHRRLWLFEGARQERGCWAHAGFAGRRPVRGFL
jgi:hypothetical protein